ncbi:MAG TPA: ABC transporter ATP-binding protein [Vicinamibacterales bacterium]|nr:ABC transporter ATP-binding protein [Vicinamibacterales bacterium]
MIPPVRVTGVGKTFRRYHHDRPGTIQETVARGIRGLSKVGAIDRFWALKNITFDVPPGRTVGIVGANGSGKSTLLRLIGGVGKPDAGKIEVRGRLGALLDLAAGFHPELSGRENAVLAGILNGLSRRQVLERMKEIVAFAEIQDALDNPIRTYSTGMQMRLAFSVAVHTEPDILLIDEVLAVGDISFQQKCLDRIRQFRAAGCSILLVSHVGSKIEEMCDDAVWLDHGQLKAEGPAGDVVRQYSEYMR